MSDRALEQLRRQHDLVWETMLLVRHEYTIIAPMEDLLRRKIWNENDDFDVVRDEMDILRDHVKSSKETVLKLKSEIVKYNSAAEAAKHRFRSDPNFESRIRRIDLDAREYCCVILPMSIKELFKETNVLYHYAALKH